MSSSARSSSGVRITRVDRTEWLHALGGRTIHREQRRRDLEAHGHRLRDLTNLLLSVQLIGLRLGVLLVSLPLFLVAAVGGAVDGATAWYLRRTRVDRESGFIYHRAKFALWIAIFVLCAVYLAPPSRLDPKSVIPPFVAIFAITVRISVAYFKKYL